MNFDASKIVILGLLALLVFTVWQYDEVYIYSEGVYETAIELQDQNKELRNSLKQTKLSQTLLMPKGLDEHYEKIRQDIGAQLIRRRDSGWLLFHATQVLHDLGNYIYGNYYTEHNFTVGTTCDKSLDIFTNEILLYVNETYQLVGGNCSESSKLQIAYEWVDYFVSYINDTKSGFGRFPTETLLNRYGDCEDQAMALALILEKYGYDTALCVIHDQNLTKYGEDGLHHVFCVVRDVNSNYNGTKITLKEYPDYGDNWLILDPTFDQPFGDNPEWVTEYLSQTDIFQIPDEVLWESLLIEQSAVSLRFQELGINLIIVD